MCARLWIARIGAALGSIVVLLGGCAPPQDDGPLFVRLVDRFAEARVSPLAAQGVATPELVLFSQRLDRLDPASSSVIAGDRLQRIMPELQIPFDGGRGQPAAPDPDSKQGLLVEGPVALIVVAPLPPGSQYRTVRARLTASELRDDAQPHVLELCETLNPQQLASDEVLRERILAALPSGRRLEPAADAEDPAYTATFVPSSTTKALLLVALVPSGRAVLDHFSLVRTGVDEAIALLPDHGFADPHVHRIEVDDLTLESVVLQAPVRFVLDTPLPRRSPRLRLRAAAIVNALSATVRVDVTVRSLDEAGLVAATSVSFPGTARSWHDARIDLTDVAGHRARIEVEVTDVGPKSCAFGIALGTPVIEGTPAAPDDLLPDVVLVSLDTVRADRIEPYGGNPSTSPHLARLAERAVVFENAIAPATWTLPSHASLFTGQLPEAHGVTSPMQRISAQSWPLLAESFRDAGYETIAVTGSGYVHPEYGFAAGFERYGTREIASADPKGKACRRRHSAKERGWLLDRLAQPRRRPLFVFVHTYAAHDYIVREDDLRAVGASSSEVGEFTADFSRGPFLERLRQSDDPAREIELLRMLYEANVRSADHVVGDVVRALEKGGHMDRTALVVLSDHGEELLEDGRLGHGEDSLREELIHVPLLMRIPGVAPRREPYVVSLLDVAPTLRELIGLPPGPEGDGSSVAALLFDEPGAAPPPRPAVAQAMTKDVKMAALRGQRWKLVVSGDAAAQVQQRLYDLAEESSEEADVGAAHPDLIHALAKSLDSRLEDARRRQSSPDEQPIGALRIAELRELGYLGGD